MPKTFTDLTRHALNGPVMGTRWSALFHAGPTSDAAQLQQALAVAVGQIDAQMSTWKPDSDLNRLNAAPPERWVDLPAHLMTVLQAGLAVGRASGGAFDIGLGDVVAAWGFGPTPADQAQIRAARGATRQPAHLWLELDVEGLRARKHGPLQIDLNGIAKGYGVDRLSAVAQQAGLSGALLAIDGELRALGSQPDGSPWNVAIEAPEYETRAAQSIIALSDMSVATSGDYRHWVEVGDRRLSHTVDPRRGMPLMNSPASVTVLAPACMQADAWATALMVRGIEAGVPLARAQGISALFLQRGQGGAIGTGWFAARPETPG